MRSTKSPTRSTRTRRGASRTPPTPSSTSSAIASGRSSAPGRHPDAESDGEQDDDQGDPAHHSDRPSDDPGGELPVRAGCPHRSERGHVARGNGDAEQETGRKAAKVGDVVDEAEREANDHVDDDQGPDLPDKRATAPIEHRQMQ